MDIVKKIITDILIAFYQPFWFAIVLSVLFMFAWKNYSSVKEAVKKWIYWFKSEDKFRRMFFLVFYTVMILFRTLFSRSMWGSPISNVIGVWGLYNNEGKLTTEVPENLALFIPFTVLLLWTYRDKIVGEKISLKKILYQSTKIVFLFSFTIEFLQLFLRLGTWQLSDLFYNSVGGFVGGLIYWVGYKVANRKKRS